MLPQEQTGYQVVLAVWTIDDTSKAFYQVIDLSLD
ncbi:lytic polysaccharide monooxygenase [Providencia hangzhouensis]